MAAPTGNSYSNNMFSTDTDRNKDYYQFANAVVIDSANNYAYPSSTVPTEPHLDLTSTSSSSSYSNRPHAVSSSSMSSTDYPLAPAYTLPQPSNSNPAQDYRSSTINNPTPPSTALTVYNHQNSSQSYYDASPTYAFPSQDMMSHQQTQINSEENPSDKKQRRRRRRRIRMAVGAAGGVVVGGVLGGPIGAVAGAVTGAAVSRAASKNGERRKDKRLAAANDRTEASGGTGSSMTRYNPMASRSVSQLGSEHVIC